jgi:hypothetical protein
VKELHCFHGGIILPRLPMVFFGVWVSSVFGAHGFFLSIMEFFIEAL